MISPRRTTVRHPRRVVRQAALDLNGASSSRPCPHSTNCGPASSASSRRRRPSRAAANARAAKVARVIKAYAQGASEERCGLRWSPNTKRKIRRTSVKWLICGRWLMSCRASPSLKGLISRSCWKRSGASARRAGAVAAGPPRAAHRAASRKDGVHRHPRGSRREEDRRHQGSLRDHRPRPQGGQGPGRGAPEAVEEGVNKDEVAKIRLMLKRSAQG